MCDKCLLDLESAYRFRMNCETSEVILEQYIEADDEKNLDVKSEEADFCVEYLEETDLKNDIEIEEVEIVEKPIPVETNATTEIRKVQGKKVTYIPLTKEELSVMKNKKKPGKVVAAPYICEICGTNYKTKSEHLNHQRRHLGEKNFACEECGSSFVDKSALVRHTRRHTGSFNTSPEHSSV
jgi:transposase-like protein